MITAFCNPLIDATYHCDLDFLKKWNLKNDDAILADASYQPLIDQVVNGEGVYMTQGGACQNTLVMAQWILQKNGKTTMVGAVGADENKKVIQGLMENAGVRCLYQEIPNNSTGCCAVLIADNNRSIVASVAASGCFDFERWDTKEVLEAIRNSSIILLSTFFLRSSDKTALAVTAEANSRKIPVAIALSSPNAIETEAWPALRQIIRCASLIFCNTTEAYTFGKLIGLVDKNAEEAEVDYMKLAKELANYDSPAQKRAYVITMGADPTIYCESGAEPITQEVIPIKTEQIVDTNGAGDSYAGGFLAGWIQGKTIPECLKYGAYSSYINLQSTGCSVPAFKPEL